MSRFMDRDPTVEAMAGALKREDLQQPPVRRRRMPTMSRRLIALREVAHERLRSGWTWDQLISWIQKPVDANGEPLCDAEGRVVEGIKAAPVTIRQVIGTPPERRRSAQRKEPYVAGRAAGRGEAHAPRTLNGPADLNRPYDMLSGRAPRAPR